MAEHDNAGFPLAYCFLSTASSIDPGKRTKALEQWATQIWNTYRVFPRFVHTDKDMAEVTMAKWVWPHTRTQLCWWHLKKAIRERVARAKLLTTPYNAERAASEFKFIDIKFRPPGCADPDEYEGGVVGESAGRRAPATTQLSNPIVNGLSLGLNSLTVRLPASTQPPNQPSSTLLATRHIPNTQPPPPGPSRTIDSSSTHGDAENRPSICVTLRLPPRPDDTGSASFSQKVPLPPTQLEPTKEKRIFCPKECRERLLEMVEAHYNTHPLIPGYAAPTKEGIREWAVKQIYQFCVKHELAELWAYLWENWYRTGRWELWARSVVDKIARLKTTMIMESQ